MVWLVQSAHNLHAVKLICDVNVVSGIARNAKATGRPRAAISGCCLQHAYLLQRNSGESTVLGNEIQVSLPSS